MSLPVIGSVIAGELNEMLRRCSGSGRALLFDNVMQPWAGELAAPGPARTRIDVATMRTLVTQP